MSRSKPSILVVDDDRDIAINMSDVLSDLGYPTDIANDGAAALKLVEQNRYDVALLDFKMPDTDGVTLYQELKKRQPALMAIMVTAYAGTESLELFPAARTWQILRKPVDFEQLLALIDEVGK